MLLTATPPAPEPISRAWATLSARIDSAAEDTLIDAYIVAAREAAQVELGRLVGAHACVVAEDVPSGDELVLMRDAAQPLADVSAIAQIEYRDAAGAWQVMPAPDYALDATDRTRCVARLTTGAAWPVTDGESGALRVTCTAGLDPVPALVAQWMLLQIGTMYEHRAALVSGAALASLPRRHVDGLLDGWRNYRGAAP
jgi:uncharacterized phiE125 gp8 family phage protein